MGLAPSEIKVMTPIEVGVWYNTMRPQKMYGRMNESQAREVTDRMNANPDKYI